MQGHLSRGTGTRVVNRLSSSSLQIGLCWCLFAQAASAQVFVARTPADPTSVNANRNGVFTADDLQSESPVNNGSKPAETFSPQETARLIEQYRREAGALGPYQWFSSVKFEFGLGLAVAYDDNIRITTNRDKQSDEITTLSGRFIASLGDYAKRQNSFIFIDYSILGNVFATHGDQDSVDQRGMLDARYRWDRLSLETNTSLAVDHDANSDINARQSNENYNESLVLRYRYSDKTTLIGEARVKLEDSEFGQDNQEYSVNQAIEYQLSDRTRVGFGLLVGRLNSGDGLRETFESPLLRVGYLLADKVSVNAQFGVDVRERGSSAGTGATPVFGLTGEWTPYGGTTVVLNGFRRVEASESLAGEDFTTTNLSLTLLQRFLRHYYALTSLDYSHDDYTAATDSRSTVSGRADDYYFARIGLGYQASNYLDCGFFYRRQENNSNLGIYSYASNRVYFQLNFLY